MENIQDLLSSVPEGHLNQIPVKKTWISPCVTEIPKFVILGGASPKTSEDTTNFISF